MRQLAIIFIGLIWSVSVIASSGNSKKAQRLIAKGDRAFDDFVYVKAVKYFQKALEEKQEMDSEVALKIADSYRLMNKSKSAEKWYKRVTNFSLMSDQDLMNYTQILLKNGKDEEAKAISERIQSFDLSNHKRLNAIEDISEYYRDSLAYFVENINVNTEQSEFSPAFLDDGFAFVSNRKRKGVRQASYGWDDTYFLDLYYARVDDGQILEPEPMSKRINTIFHEGPSVFYDGGKKMIFTRNNFNLGEERTSVEGVNKLKLYYSEKQRTNRWSRPKALPFNSDDYSVGHPTYHEATQTLYFASDMPGGLGKSDIYKVTYAEGKWGVPVNLGPEINTIEDELFPYVSEEGVLYFASHGHPGIGGLDIYKVEIDGEQKVHNMGFPINTPDDDFGMILEGNKGFLSSNREGGKGNDDLYKVNIYSYNINARLIDAKTGDELKGEISAIEANEDDILTFSEDGKIDFHIVRGKKLTFNGVAKGYKNTTLDFETTSIPLEAVSYTVDVPLDKLALFAEVIKVVNPGRLDLFSNDKLLRSFKGDLDELKTDLSAKNYKIDTVINVEAIYYDFDQASIRSDAEQNLMRLAAILEQFPTFEVVLSSHTDSRGSNAYNKLLAKRRVEQAKRFLLDKGVSADRIMVDSFGEQQLLNECEDGVNCDKDKHQLNRRTEVDLKLRNE